MQAIQSPSANRGIGRYSRALSEGLLRQAPNDQIILLLNGMVGTDNDRLRREFTQSWPNRRACRNPLIAEDDRQERPGPFVAPDGCEWFGELVAEIGRNHRPQPTAKLRSALGAGLK